MKCVECKLIKFDGQKYSCPAHPYVENIDLYTEHRNCGAPTWYPHYVSDQITVIEQNIRQLDEVMPKLAKLIQELNGCDGYGNMLVDQLKAVYQKFVDRYEKMNKEHEELIAEMERIKK